MNRPFRDISIGRHVWLPAALLAWGAMAPSAAADPPTDDAALFVRLDADQNGQLTAQEIPSEHRRLFNRLLRRADGDGDRSLSRTEFLAALAPSRPEKPLEEKQSAEFPGADAIRWLLLSMDTSGNGSITADEVPERLQSAFQQLAGRIDRNDNGVLERNELNQGSRLLSNIAPRIARQQQIDVAAELEKLQRSLGAAFDRFEGPRGRGRSFDTPLGALADPRRAEQLFAQYDANGDGQIVPAEAPAAVRPMLLRLLQLADRDGNGRLSQREFVAGVERLSGRRGARAGLRGTRGQRGRGRRGGSRSPLDALPLDRPQVGDDSSPGREGMDSMEAGDGQEGEDR